MATGEIKISEMPSASGAIPLSSLLPMVSSADTQNYKMTLSQLLAALNLLTATQINALISGVTSDLNTRRFMVHQGGNIAGQNIPNSAVGIWSTNPATLWTKQTSYSGPATDEYVQILDGTWYRKIWSAQEIADLQDDVEFRRIAVYNNSSPAGIEMPNSTAGVITNNPFALWVVRNGFSGPADADNVQIGDGRWFQRVFNSGPVLTQVADLLNGRMYTRQGGNISGADIPDSAVGVWSANPATLWTKQTTYTGPATDEYVQVLNGNWYRRIWTAQDVIDLQIDLANGRTYSISGESPSTLNIPTGVNAVVGKKAPNYVMIWNKTTAPGNGLETTKLKKDGNNVWWYNSLDSSEIAGSGVLNLKNMGGTANAMTANIDVPSEGYVVPVGANITLLPTATNTAVAPTITIDGITRTITDTDGQPLRVGTLVAGSPYIMRVVDANTLRLVTDGLSANLTEGIRAAGDLGRAAGAGAVAPIAAAMRADESARIDFRSGSVIMRSGGSVVAYEAAAFGTQALIPVPQYAFVSDGALRLSTNGKARVNALADGTVGGWFQPEVPEAHNRGVDAATLVGLSMAPLAGDGPVEGVVAQVISATASGAASRNMNHPGFNTIAGAIYQVDAIVKMADQAPFLAIRYPAGFSNPSTGGSGNFLTVDMVEAVAQSQSPNMDAEPTTVRDLGDGWRHIRTRVRNVTGQSLQNFGLVPLPTRSAGFSNTFAAGELMQVALFTQQRVESVALPPALTGASPVAIPATQMVIPADKLAGAHSEFTIEVEFAFPEGYVEADTIPIWRIDIGATLGIGVDFVDRAVRGTIYQSSRKSIDITDLYSQKFRVAVSYDGERFAMSLNGKTSSIVTNQDVSKIWQFLRFGHDNPLALGTVKRFSGVVTFWRYIPRGMSESELAALTGVDFESGPGENSPVIITDTGAAIMTKDSKGRLDFVPGERAATAIARGASFDLHDIPADAMGITPFDDGLHFMTDKFGNRPHRVKRSKDGFLVGHRSDSKVHVIWGNGQSLAYGNIYSDPVPWDITPYFLDADDGLDNSVFGYSIVGYSTDKLTHPTIAEGTAGPGGFIYPAINHAAAERAENEAAPIPIIAKTIGQSGARLQHLWPFGIYDTGEDTGTLNPGANGTHWMNVRRWHQSVADACARLGYEPYCPAFLWCQGTADENNSSYASGLDLAWNNLNTLVDEFYGQSEGVPHFLLTQSGGRANTATASWVVSEIQLDWASVTEGAHIACPLYMPDIVLADANVHPNYTSTTIFGEICGWAMEEILAGRKWHIGRPDVDISGSVMTLDFSKWLRDDERLEIQDDQWYSGVGIENVGISLHDIVNTGTLGVTQRYAASPITVSSVSVSEDGKKYIVQLSGNMTGTLGYRYGYAMQFQDMTTLDPLHFAHRGLLTTTLNRPSKRLEGRTLRRWIPSFSKEVIF